MPPGPWITIEQTVQVVRDMGIERHPWHLPGYRTIRYDQRGVGQFTGAPDARLHAQVEDLAAVLQSVQDPVVLVGYGHAGPAAITFTRTKPDRVKRLVLWCSYTKGGEE